MANVQPENGFCRLANYLIERLARTPLRGCEWQVLSFIIRQTYGWNRKTARLSVAEIAAGIGLAMDTTYRAVRELRRRNIITAEGDNHHPKVYGIQKDPDRWTGSRCRTDSLEFSSQTSPESVGRINNKVWDESATKCRANQPHPYINSKDNKDTKDTEGEPTPPIGLSDEPNWGPAVVEFDTKFPSPFVGATTRRHLVRHAEENDKTPEDCIRRIRELHGLGMTNLKPWQLWPAKEKESGAKGFTAVGPVKDPNRI